MSIKGFPTIIIFKNGKEHKRHFGAGLSKNKLLEFIKN